MRGSHEEALLTQSPPLFNTPFSAAAATSAEDNNDDVEKVVDNDKNDDADDLRER